jgi:hypothetical protein
MTDTLGVCRWCRREIEWDRYAGGWRHTESNSLLCPNGAPAAIDTVRFPFETEDGSDDVLSTVDSW